MEHFTLSCLSIDIRQPFFNEGPPVGDEFLERRLLACGGGNEACPRAARRRVFRSIIFLTRQSGAGQGLRDQTQAFTVGPGLVEEAVQVAGLILDEP